MTNKKRLLHCSCKQAAETSRTSRQIVATSRLSAHVNMESTAFRRLFLFDGSKSTSGYRTRTWIGLKKLLLAREPDPNILVAALFKEVWNWMLLWSWYETRWAKLVAVDCLLWFQTVLGGKCSFFNFVSYVISTFEMIARRVLRVCRAATTPLNWFPFFSPLSLVLEKVFISGEYPETPFCD